MPAPLADCDAAATLDVACRDGDSAKAPRVLRRCQRPRFKFDQVPWQYRLVGAVDLKSVIIGEAHKCNDIVAPLYRPRPSHRTAPKWLPCNGIKSSFNSGLTSPS